MGARGVSGVAKTSARKFWLRAALSAGRSRRCERGFTDADGDIQPNQTMKRLSQKTWDLIQKLHGDQSFWGKLIRPQNLPLSLFDEIASADEALAIPQLTEFLLNKQPEV